MISKNQLPPPGHTRGKWIPGSSIGPTETNITDNSYWCSPCGRKLASKILYNRHLRSDLHTRRSIQEIEGDIKLPKPVGTLLQSKRRSKRQQLLEIVTINISIYYYDIIVKRNSYLFIFI